MKPDEGRANLAEDDLFCETLQNARGGDSKSLGQLLESYRPWLLRIALQRVEPWMRPRVAASDVVQGSLVQAAVGFEEFRGSTRAEFQAWLHTVFVHHLIDHQRAALAQKRDAGSRARISESAVEDSTTPSKVVAGREDTARLLDAIVALDADLRVVVEMRYLLGLSFDEIGEKLNLSRYAASRRWSKAVEQLAKSLRSTSSVTANEASSD